MDQPGKVANPARGQLNREMDISLPAFAPENIFSRDGFVSLLFFVLGLNLMRMSSRCSRVVGPAKEFVVIWTPGVGVASCHHDVVR